jgi:uncharacterized protein
MFLSDSAILQGPVIGFQATVKGKGMGLRERFNTELKEAMKAKEQKRLATLRLILAGLKERDIANRSEASREGITDDEILGMLAKMVKQREESATAYEGGGRPELARSEREEIEIIRSFMPKQLAGSEFVQAIEAAIADAGATSVKDMGKVMGLLKERYSGQMDFAKAGASVRESLNKPK